jgi:hypothetical protein
MSETKKSNRKAKKVAAAYPQVDGADQRHGGVPGQSGYQDPEGYIGQGAKAE